MNRRTVAGACLIAAPVLHAASYFLWPQHSEGTHAEQLAAAGTHSSAWAAATWVETIGWLILIPAFVVLWESVRGRGRRTTGVGVWVSVLGIAGFFGAGVMNIVTIGIAKHGDRAAAVAMSDELHKSGGLFLFVVAPLMLGLLGLIALMVGLTRAGVIGWWAPVAALVGVVASEGLSASENPVLLTLAFAPVAAGWVVVSRRLLAREAAGQPAVADRDWSPAVA